MSISFLYNRTKGPNMTNRTTYKNTAPAAKTVHCHHHDVAPAYGPAGGERCLLCAKVAKVARATIQRPTHCIECGGSG